jgi:subtilisin family serine protease
MFRTTWKIFGNSDFVLFRAVSAAGLSAILMSATSFGQEHGEGGPEYIPGRYIVQFAEKTVTKGLKGGPDELVRNARSRRGVNVQHTYFSALKGFSADLTDEALAELKKDPNVISIEPDQIVRIAQKKGGSTTAAPAASSQIVPWGITRIGLGTPLAGPVNVDVAIIDSGIETPHPDLNVVGGINFVSGALSTAYTDTFGHGTHVAGTVGAKNNTIGVVGVAPGARLWAVRVLGTTGTGTLSALIAGVDWVTANASTIEVANMSVTVSNSTGLKSALDRAVTAGVSIAVAAGNASVDMKSTSPANSLNTGVITVSALSNTGVFASISNFGLNYVDDSGVENGVDVIAPGVGVISTYKGGGYSSMNGTSMAAAHVSGVAALCKVQNPTYTPDDIKEAIMMSPPSGFWGVAAGGVYGIGVWRASSGDPDGFYEPLVNAAPFAN